MAPGLSAHEIVAFAAPPVDEAFMGLQLQDEIEDPGFALTDFWPRIRGEFPRVETHPALPAAEEVFDTPTGDEPPIRFVTGPMTPRYWFLADDERRLVQLQPDRLFVNWRKRAPEDEYPRYPALREQFEARLEDLSAAASERGRGVVPTWCEVSYVNHIGASGASERQLLSDVLTVVQTPSIGPLGAPEDTQLQQRYLVLDSSDRPLGRVHLTATSALRRSDQSPIYVLTLLVRLKPSSSDADGVMATMDHAHALAAEAFRDVTTPTAHAAWGIQASDAAT